MAEQWVMRKTVGAGGNDERVERTATCGSLPAALDMVVGLEGATARVHDDGRWEWHDERHRVRVEITPEHSD